MHALEAANADLEAVNADLRAKAEVWILLTLHAPSSVPDLAGS